jgi:hypothetical protein
MRSATIAFKTELVVEECCVCGVAFAFPYTLQVSLRKTRASFFCPIGHSQGYSGETEEDTLRKQLARAEASAASWRDSYNEEWAQRKSVERQLSATKGVLTRTKNRVAHGVCPCCNRSFQNLQRHMQGKHPDYETA